MWLLHSWTELTKLLKLLNVALKAHSIRAGSAGGSFVTPAAYKALWLLWKLDNREEASQSIAT